MAQDARRAMRAEGDWIPSPSESETSTPAPSPPTQRHRRQASLETSIPSRDLRFMDRPEPRTLPNPSPDLRRPRGTRLDQQQTQQQIHLHVNSHPLAPSHIPQSDLERLTSQEVSDLRQVREYWQQARATLESAHERAGSPLLQPTPLVLRPSSPTVELRRQPRAVHFQRPEYLAPRPLRPIPASPPRPIRTLVAGRYPEVTLSPDEMRRMNIPPTPELSSPSPTPRRDQKRGKPTRHRGREGEKPGHQGRQATGRATERENGRASRPAPTPRARQQLSPRTLRRPTSESSLSQSLTSLESAQGAAAASVLPQPQPRLILASPVPSVGSGSGNADLLQQMEMIVPRLNRIRVSQASGTVPHGPTALEIVAARRSSQ